MAKAEISAKQSVYTESTWKPARKKSSATKRVRIKPGKKTIPFSGAKSLKSESFAGQALLECLKENDPEGALEILEGHLRAINRSAFVREAGIPRSTLYRVFNEGNPTLKTLAKIVHTLSKAE